MTKGKNKPSATNAKALRLVLEPDEPEAQGVAAMTLSPAMNAACVVDAYQRNIMGDDVNLMALIESLQQSTDKAKAGDLSGLEAMLIGQATALQTIFTSLAKRAVHQDMMAHYESFLGLALKAQAQSRATISALVELKYPRQAMFVRQGNFSTGLQQVNNGVNAETGPVRAGAHAQETKTLQNELLEDQSYGSTQLDNRATATPARSHTTVETVAAVNRTEKRPG